MGCPRQYLSEGQNEGSGSYLCRASQTAQKHGFKDETEAGITMELKRGTFSATFFLACIAALELDAVVLEEL
jgi:hypothetical protein